MCSAQINRTPLSGRGGISARNASFFKCAIVAATLVTPSIATTPSVAQAQKAARSDAIGDSQDALNDALLAMPNSAAAPLSNIYATAPGLEQQIPAPDARFNILAPFGYNSNAEEIRYAGLFNALCLSVSLRRDFSLSRRESV